MDDRLERIRYIIDIDGFLLSSDKLFLIKELGVADLKNDTCFLYHFQLHRKFHSLNEKDKRTASFLYHNLNGLFFKDYYGDLPQFKAYSIIQDLGRQCDSEDTIIAFKGGNIEHDILKELGIKNYLDLEDFGAPKFEILLKDPLYIETVRDIFGSEEKKCLPQNCDRHRTNTTNKSYHCPLVEVCYFTSWLINEKEKMQL